MDDHSRGLGANVKVASRLPVHSDRSQDEAPEATADCTCDRVAERTQALVRHRGAGNVPADGSAHQADQQAHEIHG
jgi:hypothetical protein